LLPSTKPQKGYLEYGVVKAGASYEVQIAFG
jgi:hypothetical protein